MKASFSLAAAASCVFALAVAAAHADPAADRCGGAKLKASGKYAQSVLYCYAAATRNNTAVETDCLNKASDKLASAFNKAEDSGGCVTSDDEGTVGGAIDSDVADLTASFTPADDDDARACASIKMKGAARQYRQVLGCFGARASMSKGPSADCIDMAHSKLVKAFSHAEAPGACTTVSDEEQTSTTDTEDAEDVVRSLSPVCGDGITGPTQQCESGDDATCPGLCSAECICVYPPECGDGVAEYPEECDDGGVDPGDGCSPSCQLENTSALCTGVAHTAGTSIDTVLVSDQFNQPIYVTAPKLDAKRLFVVERDGRIRIVNLGDDSILPTDFFDIHTLVTTEGEGGLLSMAFDPDFENNRRFFIDYTNLADQTVIARYEADAGNPNVVDMSTGHILLTIDQPFTNHKGGQLQFGSDGYLYVGMGDGGGGGDPEENGQDVTKLLGKMLRLDVNVNAAPYYAVPVTNPDFGPGSQPLIWDKGMRNPWRYSFDRANGNMVIADVGQDLIEEIDYELATDGGRNYGWDVFEGDQCYEPDPDPVCPSPPTGFTMPIFEYSHFGGCTSITGGYVYRGCALPDLAAIGRYFYSDVCHNFLRTIDIVGGAATNAHDHTSEISASPGSTASFGEDARGELYIVDLGGSVYRIVPGS